MTTPAPAGGKFAGMILPGVTLALLISTGTNMHLANELREAHAIARDAQAAAQLGAKTTSPAALPEQIEDAAPQAPAVAPAPAEPPAERRSACTWPECDEPPADASPIPAQG